VKSDCSVIYIGDRIAGNTGIGQRGVPGFRVGSYAIYPLTGDICSDGKTVHVEPKAMDVLVELTNREGEVVPRQELLDRFWGRRSGFSDECLTRCVSILRKAFGDSPRQSRFIRTIAKRGYRFVQSVVPLQ